MRGTCRDTGIQPGPTPGLLFLFVCLATIASAGQPLQAEESTEPQPNKKQVQQLVRQLADADGQLRDQAEQKLLALAPADDIGACDALLAELPQPDEQMPAEAQLRLTRIRQQIETRLADRAVAATKITLSASNMELAQLLAEVERQTGNRLVDHREQFGQPAEPCEVTLELAEQSFWPALDQLLDAAQLDPYPYSGEDTLAVVQREAGAAPRTEAAVYSGPFRIELQEVIAQHNLRQPTRSGLKVELQIAWEPRLRPIAITLLSETLAVKGSDGSPLELANTQAVLAVEVQPGNHATELTIPLTRPARSMASIATLAGTLSALVPGRVIELKFDNLGAPVLMQQQRGGVTVSLEQVRKIHDLWEFRMRLKVDSEEAGLESHRGWVYQNLSYLLDSQGEVLDNAGFETVMQSQTEVGLAYFFELPEDADIGDYTWVYRTPASIVRVPVDFELTEIPLP